MFQPVNTTPGNLGPAGMAGSVTDWFRETFLTPATDVVKDTLPGVQSGIQEGIRTGTQAAITRAITGESYQPAIPPGTTPTGGNMLPAQPPISAGVSPGVMLAIGVTAAVGIGLLLRKRGR